MIHAVVRELHTVLTEPSYDDVLTVKEKSQHLPQAETRSRQHVSTSRDGTNTFKCTSVHWFTADFVTQWSGVAEENIWTEERSSDGRLKETA
jgi:hypothetical protein